MSSMNNLSRAQEMLLYYHRKMQHLNVHYTQALARRGVLPKVTSSCPIPLCSHCQNAKQTCTPRDHGHVKEDDLLPGKRVSCDHFSSPVPAIAHASSGKQLKDKYHYAALFVDHASYLTYIKRQFTTNAQETVEIKTIFEQCGQTFGVSIKGYYADNQIFNSRLFRESAIASNQSMRHSGGYAHYQNGVAERKIRYTCNLARASIFQAATLWPDAISVETWPYAVNLAVDMHNNCPKENGISPIEMFSNCKQQFQLKHFHPFGCPVFMLDPALADRKRIPRWSPRSRQGIFLGKSRDHASSVSLALNRNTNYVSLQYHLAFDDNFTTVTRSGKNSLPSNWEELFKTRINDEKQNDSSPFNKLLGKKEILIDFDRPLQAIYNRDKVTTVKVKLKGATEDSEQNPNAVEPLEVSQFDDADQQEEQTISTNQKILPTVVNNDVSEANSVENKPCIAKSGRKVTQKIMKSAVFGVLTAAIDMHMSENTAATYLNDLTQINVFKANL